ncbi:alpha/beta hydrolase [Crossiella cryophila]|uniref:Pimeloyl-ACP methyl ester carboxylesterase n=1 Tax=Crossiella cryophila TaxID=43355 RepID=A0A7W7CCP1_9PSEU|nr:alpha/beta hydrolase [Crossiella cryophila]MBB4678745.1 pimeloyl-ACP methyl ester carboxylesterase [Crossiella cryophila]
MRHQRALRTALAAITGLTLLPATAAATPSTGGTRFHQQQPAWQQCTPHPDYPGIQWERMECATVQVPLDYREPGADTLDIQVTRIKAKEPAVRRGVLLLNPGGPGGLGSSMPVAVADNRIARHFDLIGFDPRGVGRSTRLQCEGQDPIDQNRPADEEFPKIAAEARELEAGCQRAGGRMRPHISTANTARDMDVIRAVLGEKKINYLGYSYGTYLGAVYGSLFPQRLNRSVLDSAMHPDWLYRETWKHQSIAAGENVEVWSRWLAERDRTFRLGATPAAVRRTLDEVGRKLAVKPVDLLDPPPGMPQLHSVERSLFDSILTWSNDRPMWQKLGLVVGRLRELTGSKPDPDTSAALGLLARRAIPETMPGAYYALNCEADWPSDLNTYYRDMKVFRDKHPYGSGAMAAAPKPCTFRGFTPPEKPVALNRNGYPTGLVIQAEGDIATHYAGGPAMARRLRDHLISVPDDGSHGLYGHNTCVTAKVDEYLINGVLPGPRSLCAGSPRPDVPADGEPVAPQAQPGSLADGIRSIIARYRLDRLR